MFLLRYEKRSENVVRAQNHLDNENTRRYSRWTDNCPKTPTIRIIETCRWSKMGPRKHRFSGMTHTVWEVLNWFRMDRNVNVVRKKVNILGVRKDRFFEVSLFRNFFVRFVHVIRSSPPSRKLNFWKFNILMILVKRLVG